MAIWENLPQSTKVNIEYAFRKFGRNSKRKRKIEKIYGICSRMG